MLILATKSSTKRSLMDRSGLEYIAMPADVDERSIENAHPSLNAKETVILLARAKAKKLSLVYTNEFIIAADTFGVLPDGSRLRKAKTTEETMKMCLSQSGQTVTIYTGICVAHRSKFHTDTTETKITYTNFDRTTLEKVWARVAGSVRRNAALGFHVDAPGFTLVERIEGSYLGALGLPLDKVRLLLHHVGYENIDYT